MSEKTAMLGGSFDPVHLGHLFLLHCAVTLTDYNRFILVPAKLSNFKQNSRPVASDSQRLEMLKLALDDYYRIYPKDRKAEIIISDIELKRGGVSYTSDTVDYLLEKYSVGKVGLIMGDDHIAGLKNWHNFEDLKTKVQFLICNRNNENDEWKKLPDGIDFVRLNPDTVAVENSTSVRNNVLEYLNYLPDEVASYVRENNLYN